MQQPSPRTIWITENPSYYLQNLFSMTGMLFLLINMQQAFTNKLILASVHSINQKTKAHTNSLLIAPMCKYCPSVNNTNHLLKNNYIWREVSKSH